MSPPAMVALHDLWYAYNGSKTAALQGLTLEVPAGSVTAILGPNGSGKTTLLHLILGLLTPTRGTIELAGRPQTAYSRRELGRLLALVPQKEHLTFNFTVLEYVLLGRAPYLQLLETPRPTDRQAALEALRTVGAEALQERGVTALSGGEQQLVTLARALAQQPRLLLLDEPTAHLDLGNQARVLEVMRRLCAGGVTVLFTTHDPNAAAAVADHVILMRQGRVLAAAPTAAALTAENLRVTYNVPVEVAQVGGRLIALPSQEAHRHAQPDDGE